MEDLRIGAGIGVEFEIGYHLGASQRLVHGGPDGYARFLEETKPGWVASCAAEAQRSVRWDG
jgi:hypothetical protein